MRRFPPPWTVEETDACFIVRDHGGQALACVYFEEEPGRGRAAAHLRRGVAHRGESSAAAEATGLYRPHFRYDLNSRHFAGLRSLTSWAIKRHLALLVQPSLRASIRIVAGLPD